MTRDGYRESRLAALREKMSRKGTDLVLVESPVNVFYLSGFTGSNGTLLITATDEYLLTDPRYAAQAAAEAEGFSLRVGREHYDLMAEIAAAAVWGLEEEFMTLARYAAWRQALPRAVEQPFSAELAGLRQKKDAGEREILRRAVAVTDEAFRYILGQMGAGVTEAALARRLEYFLREHGASGPAFPFIVASGFRGALPHGRATDKPLAVGDLVVMDFGGVFAGYHSDFTRTVCIGRADSRQREIYAVVLAAQLAGLAALRPGALCREVDAAARRVIEAAGYGAYFTHSFGHSLGLAVHEKPTLGPKDDTRLEEGMAATAEPGVYIPDWGGIRIEDVALITADGAEVLTGAPKDLIIV
ncbi:MAG: aminopeptidase P family protein [Gracilibacteraceae bacterium]|jgi:Xaa-Pro aminopeptidase|nr:aminopeptidase P family protein [Gracilibacteraceae bacterium]